MWMSAFYLIEVTEIERPVTTVEVSLKDQPNVEVETRTIDAVVDCGD